MYTYFLFFFIIFSLIFTYFCKRKNLIVDYKLEKHKRFSSKLKSNSIGGIFLIIFFIYEFLLIQSKYIFLLFLIFIFIVGFMSDIKRLNNVGLRFFLQLILIILFSKIIGIEIQTTKIDFVDQILSYEYINIIFVTFCLMVLINGGNFIDGLNGLMLKYYILIFLVIFFYFGYHPGIDKNFLINFILILIVILSLNLLGYIYMGDSGAYLLSLFTGVYLINFSYNHNFVSPYFIILLLWYPCFELLFSMIRRFIYKSKTYKPDVLHLHQFIYNFIKSKIISNELMCHLFTSLSINFYNLIIFILASNFIYNSEILITFLIGNIIIYLVVYKFLHKKNYEKSN